MGIFKSISQRSLIAPIPLKGVKNSNPFLADFRRFLRRVSQKINPPLEAIIMGADSTPLQGGRGAKHLLNDLRDIFPEYIKLDIYHGSLLDLVKIRHFPGKRDDRDLE